MAKQDMFGMGAEPEDDQDQGEGEDVDYVLLQLISADGWRVVFDDPTAGSNGMRTLGLACFALVEIVPDEPGAPPARAIRPMVANEDGQIDDVAFFEEFICLVPPGTELTQHVEYAIRKRDAEAGK
jgi:hypothetical protein